MTISVTGGLLTEPFAITDGDPADVFTAERRTLIVSIVVTPSTGTPTLTLSRYDGTTRSYMRNAVAMTAGTAFVWNEPFMLDPEGTVEVESSSGTGDMTGWVTYLNPVAPAVVRGTT
jgi:hypothetical protein